MDQLPPVLPLDRPLREFRQIAVLRALHLGDLLCAVPAFRALRRAAPAARIVLVGLAWARSFVERYAAYLDDFLEFPGFPGFVEAEGGYAALRHFATRARAEQFDLAIQMHGSGNPSNRALRLLGARQQAGYYLARRPGPSFLPWREAEPEIRRWQRLVHAMGAPDCGEAIDWPFETADGAERRAIACQLQLFGRAYVCVHPGARQPSRRWPLQHFAQVAEALAKAGWTVVITGSRTEQALAAELRERVEPALRSELIDACGATSLGAMASLLARARLLVSNDTGVSHLAVAVGTPSVVISSGGDARRWAPLDGRRHRVLWHPTACRPCGHAQCPIDHACARGVAVDAVLAAIHDQIGQHRQVA